jgi:hypothetical protein
MGSIVGWVLGPLTGMLVFASDVKADWNCLLSIFAFSDAKLINKQNKLYKKIKRNPKYKEQYQETKNKLQNEMRNSYWRYIENMIFDIEINEPDQPSFKKNYIIITRTDWW